MRVFVLATVVVILPLPALAQQRSPLDLARQAGEAAGFANVCRSKEADDKAARLDKAARSSVPPRDLPELDKVIGFAMFRAEREARIKGC